MPGGVFPLSLTTLFSSGFDRRASNGHSNIDRRTIFFVLFKVFKTGMIKKTSNSC